MEAKAIPLITQDQREFAAHILGVLGGRLWRTQHPEEATMPMGKAGDLPRETPALPSDHYLNSDTERLRRQFANEILNGDWPAEDWNR